MEGVAGYMQQSLSMAKSSGKQPGIMDKLTGPEIKEDSADLVDFKSSTSLEMQAIMAQALASSSNWGPHNMMRPVEAAFQALGWGGFSAATPLDSPTFNLTSQEATTQATPEVESLAAAPLLNGLAPVADFMELTGPMNPMNPMNLEDFKSKLQSEFGDKVTVMAVGASAWD